MGHTDRKRFALCLAAASEVYSKVVSQAAANVWWDLTKKYDIEAVETAFAIHMADPDNGQFMPKPADIIRRITGTSQDSALRAWAMVDKAVRSVGPWASVTFDDPITMRVLSDMGGWCWLGDKTDDAWPFVAKEFENRYRGYKQRGELPEHPSVLIGYTDATNVKNGYRQGAPVLIGDTSKAAHVLAAGSNKPQLQIVRPVGEVVNLPVRATADATE